MKLKLTAIILAFLFVTGCSGNLTEEEILEQSIEKMGELESYSFKLYSEYIDGAENETVLDIQGETLIKPFHASVQKDLELFGQSIESKAYYLEDMVYYEEFIAPEYLFKGELSEQPNHLLPGLEGLHSRLEQLQFSEQDDVYRYEYSADLEEDKALGEGLYRVKMDGSNKQQLTENEVSEINVKDDWLFFTDVTQGRQAYRMKIDGTEREQITDTYTQNLIVVDDWLYFMPITNTPNGETRVYYLDLNDLESKPTMFAGGNARQFAVSDGWLYFENVEDGHQSHLVHVWDL